jgi:hypothetical protein
VDDLHALYLRLAALRAPRPAPHVP